MQIEVTDQPIDAWTRISDYENSHTELAGKHGANVVFLGRMRDFNESDAVSEMQLEHYPGMTEKFLEGIAEQAMQQWLRRIPDDPSGLLREKFRYESQQRQEQGEGRQNETYW